MPKPKKKIKAVKGYVYEEFLKKGWSGTDHAIFVYRKIVKNESHMIPVLITPITKPSKH